MTPKVSVVIATYNRARLLERAIQSYYNGTMDRKDIELIYVDDWSEDHTDAVLRTWSERLNITVIRPPYKPPGTWRSEASIINIGLRAARGELIIGTHPEVLVGQNSLQAMYDHRRERTYHACKPYYLNVQQQAWLDETHPYMSNPLLIRDVLPDFYAAAPAIVGAAEEYHPLRVEAVPTWESWMIGGGMRSMWQAIGGFWPFTTWGSIDVWFVQARAQHHIHNETELDLSTYCMHQNHDVLSGHYRLAEECLASLTGVPLKANEVW